MLMNQILTYVQNFFGDNLQYFILYSQVFFVTLCIWRLTYFLLNTFDKNFSQINPDHKQWYTVKNYVKSLYLGCLTLYVPSLFHMMYKNEFDMVTIKYCCIIYIVNDLIGLIIVEKLPSTTKMHHTSVTIMGFIVLLKSNAELDIPLLAVLYASMSSIAYLTNFFLGLRVYSTNKSFVKKTCIFAKYMYQYSCYLNWILQAYLLWSIWSNNIIATIFYCIFLYVVIKDDIILIGWLDNEIKK